MAKSAIEATVGSYQEIKRLMEGKISDEATATLALAAATVYQNVVLSSQVKAIEDFVNWSKMSHHK